MFFYLILWGTYQFPGIADIVCILAVIPETVGVPGQRGVKGHFNDLTAQRETAKTKSHIV